MPREVDDLVEAVAEGEDIDFRSLRVRSAAGPDRLSNGLELISQLRAPVQLETRRAIRLSPVLEMGRMLALVSITVGLAGYWRLSAARYRLMAALLLTFAGAAAYLHFGARDRRARALSAFYSAAAAAFALPGIRELASAVPTSHFLNVILWLRPEAFFPAALWQFGREFPAITRFGRLDALCLNAVRLTTMMGTALLLANLVPAVVPAVRIRQAVTPFLRLNEAGVGFWLVVFIPAVAALAVISRRGCLAVGAERARARLFLYSVAFAFGPIATQVILIMLFPSYLRFSSTPQGFFVTGLAVYVPLFLFPIATAYAVVSSDVLNVRNVVQRGVRYLLARWIVLWGAAVPLGLLLWHVYRNAKLPLDVILAVPPGPVLERVSAGAVALLIMRRFLVRLLDRWLLPGADAPSTTLASMTELMKHARTPLEVARSFAEGVERALQAPSRVYVLMGGHLIAAAGGSSSFIVESAIPTLIESCGGPCFVSSRHRGSYYDLLLAGDRAWIDRDEVEIVAPILSRLGGAGLLGAIAVSSRKNALRFSDDDLHFLKTASSAAGLACEALVSETQRTNQAAVNLEELALECVRCRIVTERHQAALPCLCGGEWKQASLPKRIMGLEIRRWLGAGGMGVVYLATDRLGRDVAVKTLPALTVDAAERMMDEARAMAALSHDDVGVLYGVEHWRGTPLIVMEFLPGGTLADRLQPGAMDPRDAFELARTLARSLARIHAEGLYHGDVKPSNIGFRKDGRPKFLDFGLSRLASQAMLDRTSVSGTWAYMSNEARAGRQTGVALDLWALGVVLCECLLGHHPSQHAASSARLDAAIAQALRTLSKVLDPRSLTAIATCVSAEPSVRPESAAAFESLLRVNDQ